MRAYCAFAVPLRGPDGVPDLLQVEGPMGETGETGIGIASTIVKGDRDATS